MGACIRTMTYVPAPAVRITIDATTNAFFLIAPPCPSFQFYDDRAVAGFYLHAQSPPNPGGVRPHRPRSGSILPQPLDVLELP
ncbi:MAG: hypothetical protein E6G47_12570 [Actinobacteria bacterium]|nr:MAG: hypothetical protein E6G47_12570 [Actinomycetota bacterium]